MRNRFNRNQPKSPRRGIRARLRDGSCLSPLRRMPKYAISLVMICPECGTIVNWNGREWFCNLCSWKGQNALRSLE